MKLVLRGSEEAQAEGSHVEGRATIVLAPERRQLIGVRTGTVERRPFARGHRRAAGDGSSPFPPSFSKTGFVRN
jgi:hypothetical protein